MRTIEKANIIVEFKEMLRQKYSPSDDCCEVESPLDFDFLLEEYTEYIPEHLRCISQNYSCNRYSRCECFLHTHPRSKLISYKSMLSGGERMVASAVIWKNGNGVRKICHIITCLSHASMTVGSVN